MFNKRNIGALLVLAIPSIAALSFHSYLGSMSRFLADDYCEAYIAQHFGLFRSIWYWYISWDGAYSDSIIDWLLAIIKPGGIPFVTPIVLIIWVAVTAATIFLFLPQEFSFLIKVLTSFVFGPLLVFVTLLISPDVPQSLYWWTGMRSYILPLVLFTFYLCLFQLIIIKWKKGNIFLWSLLSFGIIFLIGGLSETFTPVLTVFFVGWIAWVLLTKKQTSLNRSFFFILGGVLGVLTSLIVIVAAPGNTNRQALYQSSPGIIGIFNISISAFLTYISHILITPEKIAGLLGAFLASLWFGSFIVHKNKTRPWIPAAVLFSGIVFTFGCFLPAALGIYDAPPERTLSIPSFMLVATILISGFFTGSLLPYTSALHKPDGFQTGLVIITLACLGFSAWVNVHNLYNTRRAYIEYGRKWDMVNQQIIQAQLAGKKVIHIPAMDSWTTLDRPRDKAWFWQNVCYSKYYGIQIIGP